MNKKITVLRPDGSTFEVTAVATFNEGNSCFYIDDHCYVLANRTERSGNFRSSLHIFKEAMNVLKDLPSLDKSYKTCASLTEEEEKVIEENPISQVKGDPRKVTLETVVSFAIKVLNCSFSDLDILSGKLKGKCADGHELFRIMYNLRDAENELEKALTVKSL